MHILKFISVIFVVVISSQRRKSLTKKKIREVKEPYTCVGGAEKDSCKVPTTIKYIGDP
jgi:hypothetical protein